mmetsp:Transcript_30337/g.72173  ORF Transcript_30337/g.72173 Transcript_30337/m.72173 type:complete len:622 (+) Transcript_30337:120-1985(+)
MVMQPAVARSTGHRHPRGGSAESWFALALCSSSAVHSAHLDDACADQLLDLGHDLGVAHVLLCSLGVLLHVVEDLAHHRVREDALDLGVGHRPRLALLELVLRDVPLVHRIDLCNAPVEALLQLRVVRVDLEALLVRVHRLVVLLHDKLDVALAGVPLGKGGAELDALVGVLLGLGHRAELDVAGGAVGVVLVALGVHRGRPAHDRLRVALDGLGELLILEEGIALLLLLIGKVEVDVLLLLLLLQCLLGLVQPAEGVGVPVLQERLLVDLDGRLHVALLHQRVGLPCHRAGDQLVVRVHLPAAGDGLVAVLDALVVVAHLIVDGGLVGEEADVRVIELEGRLVALDRLLKLLLLVVRVAPRLLLQRLLLPALPGLLLVVQLRLGLRLRLGRRRRLRFRRWGFPLRRRSIAGVHDGNAEPHGERLHDLGVLEVLSEAARVLLEVADLLHEGGVRDEVAGLGARRELGEELGRAEHRADAPRSAARALLSRLLRRAEAILHCRVLRVELEPLLIGSHGLVVLLQAHVGRCNAGVPLGPVRLELHHLVCVLKRFLVLLQARLARGAVAVQNVVGRVEVDSSREMLHCFCEVSCGEGCISFRLELLGRHFRSTSESAKLRYPEY